MINPITRYLIIALVLASAAAVGILAYQNQGLEGKNKVLTVSLTTAQTTVKTQLVTIGTLEENAKKNEEAHAKLLQQIASTKNLLTKHEQTIRNLERENEQLKIWSNTSLPAAVILLRQRPAITGSQGYREWLSERDTMSATINKALNQR